MPSQPRPRCVVLDGATLTSHVLGEVPAAGEPSWDALAEAVDLTVYPRTPADQTLERSRGAELLLTNKVVLDGSHFAALPELSYIGVLATGTNVVDLQAAAERGLSVTNVPAYAADSVVAHVFALVLELLLRVGDHARAVSRGAWSSCPDFSFRLQPTHELHGLTLGILGLGNIGRRVATVGHAFGMRVIAGNQPSMHRVKLPDVPVHWMPEDAVFEQADVITLHCPLLPETHGLVHAGRLRRMKPSAILINTGRGPLVDEEALVRALSEGWIAGAGLDVLGVEPPAADHPLLSAPNCIITPHLAWASVEARQRLMDIATANVLGHLEGRPQNLVR